MANDIQNILGFSTIPALCMILGSLIALIKTPSDKVASWTQHFAAGVVFAAVALELLPKLTDVQQPLLLSIGFLVGLFLMLFIKELTEFMTKGQDSQSQIPLGLLTAVGIDLFIDGLLIGISFVSGEKGGVLIAIALAIEILFLGLATVSSLSKSAQSLFTQLIIILFLASLIVVGAYVGGVVILNVNQQLVYALLAFGVAALLYLVTEELLKEAHEAQDTPIITAGFFLGFLIIFLIDTQLKM